jgi:hypothetical protein
MSRRVAEQLGDGVGRGERVAGRLRRHDRFGPAVESAPVRGGDAEVMGDHHAGERLEELRHDVALADLPEALDPLEDERPHLRLQRDDLSRREPSRHETAEGGVLRRIEHDHRRRIAEARLRHVAVREGQALRGGERRRVPRGREHVGEAG